MKNFGPSQMTDSIGISGKGESTQPGNPGSSGKMTVKMACVCANVNEYVCVSDALSMVHLLFSEALMILLLNDTKCVNNRIIMMVFILQ